MKEINNMTEALATIETLRRRVAELEEKIEHYGTAEYHLSQMVKSLTAENAELKRQVEGIQEDAVAAIAAERQRQKEVEGWTESHDDRHANGELSRAAACYAAGTPIFSEVRRYINGMASLPHILFENLWPWEGRWFKPSRENRVRDLVKAGALIVAEIERLHRLEALREAAKGGVEC